MEENNTLSKIDSNIGTPTVHLVARNSAEMEVATSSLKIWLQNKVKLCITETTELFAAYEIARQSKWKSATLLKHAHLAQHREDFYKKALVMVNAGYAIVPNFPIDLFAIRVNRERPCFEQSSSYRSSRSAVSNASDLKAQVLPEGKGRYVNPLPIGTAFTDKTKEANEKEIIKYFFNTEDFQEVLFPIVAARPEVMSATAAAMTLKCFDAIGICPQSRKGDPLIIGQVLAPEVGYTQKVISFLIAWHLDLRTL